MFRHLLAACVFVLAQAAHGQTPPQPPLQDVVVQVAPGSPSIVRQPPITVRSTRNEVFGVAEGELIVAANGATIGVGPVSGDENVLNAVRMGLMTYTWAPQPANVNTHRKARVSITISPPPPHRAHREVLLQGTGYELRASRAEQWCLASRTSGVYARVSMIAKSDRDFSPSPALRATVETEILPAVRKTCPNVERLVIDYFVAGVRVLSPEGEIGYGEQLPNISIEVPISFISVRRMPDGSMRYDQGSDDAVSLASLRAKRSGQAAAVAQAKALQDARPAMVASLLASMKRVPLNTTGMRDPAMIPNLVHGISQPDVDTYRFRMLFNFFFMGYEIRCPAQLKADVRTVPVYEPVFADWVTRRGGVVVGSVPTVVGREQVGAFKVPARFAGKFEQYTQPANAMQVGHGLGMAEYGLNNAETRRNLDTMTNDLKSLFDNNACDSLAMLVLMENLHQHSLEQPSIQRKKAWAIVEATFAAAPAGQIPTAPLEQINEAALIPARPR